MQLGSFGWRGLGGRFLGGGRGPVDGLAARMDRLLETIMSGGGCRLLRCLEVVLKLILGMKML